MDYQLLLEHSFSMETEHTECAPTSRLEYLSDYIFDFETYDSSMAELFAKKAVEVCEAITNRKTFEYIAGPEGYLWYLLMCNMPFFSERLQWGTSIRGAWWEASSEAVCPGGFWVESRPMSHLLRLSGTEEWKEFVKAIIAFAAPEMTTDTGPSALSDL